MKMKDLNAVECMNNCKNKLIIDKQNQKHNQKVKKSQIRRKELTAKLNNANHWLAKLWSIITINRKKHVITKVQKN